MSSHADRCNARTTTRTGPLSPRIVFQAIVRIRKLVKNGTTTSPSSRFLLPPALNAMKYASG